MTSWVRCLAFLALLAGCRRNPAVAPQPLPEKTPLYDSTRALTAEELAASSLRELVLTRATITARAGDVFDEWWIQEYFFGQPWYAPARFDESRLSDLDRRNLATVEQVIARMTPDDLRARLEPLAAFVHGEIGAINHVAFSLDASRAVTAHDNTRRVSVWSVPDGSEALRLSEKRAGGEDAVFADFSRDGTKVVAGFTGWSEKQRRRYGRVVSWDSRSGEQLSEVEVPLQWPTKLAVHFDGGVAIGAKGDHVVAVWGLDGKEVATWTVPDDRFVFDIAFAPDGLRAILGTSLWTSRSPGESRVVLLDVNSGDSTEVWSGSSNVSAVAWSRDGARIASGHEDGAIRVWSVPRLTPLSSFAIGAPVHSLRLPGSSEVRATSRLGLTSAGATGPKMDLTAFDVSKENLALAALYGEPLSSGLHLLDEKGEVVPAWQGHARWPGDEERIEYFLLRRALGETLAGDVLDEADVDRWTARPSGAADSRLLEVALTEADLTRLDACALAALRLHIRARRGFPRTRFGEHTHLSAPPGYVADPEYDDSRLTATDLENLGRILAAEVRVGSRRVASARRSWADVAWGIVPGGPSSEPGDSDWSFYYAQCAY